MRKVYKDQITRFVVIYEGPAWAFAASKLLGHASSLLDAASMRLHQMMFSIIQRWIKRTEHRV